MTYAINGTTGERMMNTEYVLWKAGNAIQSLFSTSLMIGRCVIPKWKHVHLNVTFLFDGSSIVAKGSISEY